MKKIPKNTIPNNHSFSDFKCSGPIAQKNGEFANTKIADMLCFSQEKIKKTQASDSNKFYCALICTSKINNNPYVYVEYGRVGNPKTQFQFTECSSEMEAEKFYIAQCSSKNTKRANKIQHKVLGEIWEAKPGKDFYQVQNLTSRNLRISDANNIGVVNTKKIIHKGDNLDDKTRELFADLGAGTQSYTRNSIVGGTIPAQAAINEVRLLLDEATKITNKISNKEYLDNKELKQISTLVYGRIPKKKTLGSNEWILTPDQVHLWRTDLDSYESALSSNIYECNTSLSALNLIKFKYVPRDNEMGGWVYDWFNRSTANKHSYLRRQLSVKNIWYFERIGDNEKLEKYQKSIGKVSNQYEPAFIPKRKDKINCKLYNDSATYILWHGTRSVNVASIIKESLRFPKELSRSQITGSLFGGGTYMASDTKKSIGYTSYKGSYWSNGAGQINNRGAFMFLVDSCLGKLYRCKYGHTSGPPAGYHSVFAQAGYSGVQNDEHILFDKSAIKLRYLVEFE